MRVGDERACLFIALDANEHCGKCMATVKSDFLAWRENNFGEQTWPNV